MEVANRLSIGKIQNLEGFEKDLIERIWSDRFLNNEKQ
jgi:hypothetical protein